jgi:hypothetical protein
MTIETIRTQIENTTPRSAWARGVKAYAIDLLSELPGDIVPFSREFLLDDLLNGASDWTQYSYGGCALVYDEDIALRLCTPSELKKTRNGERKPNAREDWLDVQARALFQAAQLILTAVAK